MVGFEASELLIFLLLSTAGQPSDLASLLSPQDYFKTRDIEISINKMVELAAKDPSDGPTQIAQLLALRVLGENGTFKKAANYATQRRVLEEIAAGRKAQDKLGFAKEYARRTLTLVDGGKPHVPDPLGPRQEGLAWFPASATFVAGIEFQPSPVADVPKSAVAEILKDLPLEIKKEIYMAAEAVGNVQIQRVTAAFVDEGMD